MMTNLQIKETKIKKNIYTNEINLISRDIDLVLKKKKKKLNAKIIRKIIFLSISNLIVWEYKDAMLKKRKKYYSILRDAMYINSIRNSVTNSMMIDFKENELAKNKITKFTKKDPIWVKYLKKKLNEK